MPLWLLFLTLSSIIINIFTVMLFVFVLGINQYYLPLFCITMQKKKKKRQASLQDTLIACEHPEPHPSRPLASSRVSSLTLWQWEERLPLCRWSSVVSILGLWESLYIELSSCFINKNKLYTWIHGTSAEELNNNNNKTICTCVKGQLDDGLSWEGQDWVDYFNMTILYLSNPSPRGHKD